MKYLVFRSVNHGNDAALMVLQRVMHGASSC